MELPKWLADLVTEPAFQWLSFAVGVLGTALTALGTMLTIKAWRADRQNARAFDYLLRIADRHIDKELTEQEIVSRHDQLEEMSGELSNMRAYVETEIPLQAQRIAFQDRLNDNVARLHETLQSTLEIEAALKKLGQPSDLPPDLISSVQDAITPDYLGEVYQRNLKTYLTLSAVVMAISSTILPDPLRLVVTVMFAAICVTILFKLARDQFPTKLANEHVPMLHALAGGLAAGALTSLLLSWVIFSAWRRHSDLRIYEYFPERVTMPLIMFNLAMLLAIGAVVVWICYQSLLARAGAVAMGFLGVVGLMLWVFVAAINPYEFIVPLGGAFALFEFACGCIALALLSVWTANRVNRNDRRR